LDKKKELGGEEEGGWYIKREREWKRWRALESQDIVGGRDM
jgi:hypothetical protein